MGEHNEQEYYSRFFTYSNTLKDALKIVSKDQQNSASIHLAGLPYQGLSIKSVIVNIAKKNITQWASGQK